MFHAGGLVNVNAALLVQETGTSPTGITSYSVVLKMIGRCFAISKWD